MSLPIRNFWDSLRRRSINLKRHRAAPSRLTLEVLEHRVLPAASVLISPASHFYTTESGGATQFQVVLSQAPVGRSRTVVIPIQSSNLYEGTVSASELTFTSLNWNVPQTITVRGVDDPTFDGDQSYEIELGNVRTKARNYKRVNLDDLGLINQDNDGPPVGIRFDPAQFVLNDASSRSVSIRLNARPIADVNLLLEISKGVDQAQISHSTLTFTRANWNVAQQLTIGAFMDGRHDGDQLFELTVQATSHDLRYHGLANQKFTALIHDVDPLTASLDGTYIGGFSGSRTVDGEEVSTSGAVEFSIQGGVLTVTAPDGTLGTINGDQVTFTTTDGTVFTGAFTENADGSLGAGGTWKSQVNGVPIGSGTWSAVDLLHVSYTVQVNPGTNIILNEGAQRDYLVSLTAPPTADVEVLLSVTAGGTQATLSKTSLIFTPANWNIPQAVTVTGVADDGLDGDQIYEFNVRWQSADPHYDSLQPLIRSVTIHDTEVPPVTFDGNYKGTYTGSVVVFGTTTPVGGLIDFTVEGSTVTVNKPANATGTLTGDTVNFAPTSGMLAGAVFTGKFVDNGDGTATASGTWSVSRSGATGSGTWTATRLASV